MYASAEREALTMADRRAGFTSAPAPSTMLDGLLEALTDIANYVLPVFEHDGASWVRVEHAEHLRSVAREALKDVLKATQQDPRP